MIAAAQQARPRLIAYGTLPTRPYLEIAARAEGWSETSLDELWALMLHEKNHGSVERLGALLTRLGFAWRREGEARHG
jgi:hypothetical protein